MGDLNFSDDWQSDKTLSETNRVLLEKEIATDVQFVFPEQHIVLKAHRLILMSRSHIFYVMFTSGLQKLDQDIEIYDIEPEVFREMLKFLYTEDVDVTGHDVMHLLYAAEKYGLLALKNQCIEFLERNLSESTVWGVLDQAKFYGHDDLYKKCLQFLESNPSVSGLEEYHVKRETLEILFGLDVDAVSLFSACYNWANKECMSQGSVLNRRSRRKVLGPILSKIPFCSLGIEDFATHVSEKGILTQKEEVQVFRYLAKPYCTDPPFPCCQVKRRWGTPMTFQQYFPHQKVF